MAKQPVNPAELSHLGIHLLRVRTERGLTQKQLATRSGIAQPRLSSIEQGLLLPTLRQLIRLAHALAVPVQWFLNGSVTPGDDLADLALELQALGVADLLVPEAVVPGAFRPVEQVFALAVAGNQPEPRLIEALPAILAWNRWSPTRLRAECRQDRRAGVRLAWLADIAITLHRNHGFPGGCPQHRELERYLRWWSEHPRLGRPDDLGRPALEGAVPPVWKRWKILYDAPFAAFLERARHLHSLRRQQGSPSHRSTRPTDE